ncbi:MAG TPA: hypothetical protein VKV15_07690 [Bryobacteraceae bacterium]|nr:hypothetical protein [Bryobacteraceae bacterium]
MDEEQMDVRTIIQDAIQEYVKTERAKAEPAYKAELVEERKRREDLERRLNELAEENKRSRTRADEAERASTIRAELQRLGVAKIDLAFKAVKEDVLRTEDGRLIARGSQGEVGVRDYLTQFVNDNPEFLPARITGGSGASGGQKAPASSGSGVDLDRIKPGMSAEELERVRHEISHIASQTLRGL